jgi:predicted amidophosphoribosyltransferase
MFVRALKGHQLNGYCHVPIGGVQRKLNNRNLEQAVQWFGILGAELLGKKKVAGDLALVPIPSSNCTTASSSRPTIRRLARALCERIGATARLVDCLRWKKNLGSASMQGGPRDASTLYANLVLTEQVPPGIKVVLVDDVLTSGGHFRACAAKLKAGGAEVAIGICGGRTAYDQDMKPFDLVEELAARLLSAGGTAVALSTVTEAADPK